MLAIDRIEYYSDILKKELIPAMGCTEPIAIALAAAVARETLGEPVARMKVGCSGGMIKNAKSALIPGTGGLSGMEAAAVAGALAGKAGEGLRVLSAVSEAMKAEIAAALRDGICTTYQLDSAHELHILIDAWSASHTARVEVRDEHDKIVLLLLDGVQVAGAPYADASDAPDASRGAQPGETRGGRYALSIAGIKEYADAAQVDALRSILEPQVRCNMAIAREGLSGKYGLNYGKRLLGSARSVYDKMEAFAAAASEARMSGCSMPVVINSGSGNQGIAASVPSIVYCAELGYSEERMLRMLAFANLCTIYQKQFIGKLSAFCGAVSAACASGAALTYAEDGSLERIGSTITNTLAVMAGVICDGAKASCGAKIAAGLHAAFIAHRQAMDGLAYRAGDGIVCRDADETIQSVGRIAREGMDALDEKIVEVMLGVRG